MTASLAADFSRPLHATTISRRCLPGTSERVTGNALRNWRNSIAALTRSPDRARVQEGQAVLPGSPPGVIGGAVIHAGRRSAGLTRRKLARTMTTSPQVVRSWENGTFPLFCVSYSQLCRLAAALSQAGARVGCDVTELVLASQCDLLVAGILHGIEDYAEVPPIDEDGANAEIARGLLRWALTGAAPEQYRPFAQAGSLLTRRDLIAFTALARSLSAGSHGDQLTDYGACLIALAMR